MATHSSVLAWKIPGTGEPGESQGRGSLVGCRLWGRTALDTTEVTYHQWCNLFNTSDYAWLEKAKHLCIDIYMIFWKLKDNKY